MKKDKEIDSITLPQMLEKYASIYNKNGRIGIYTKDVRLRGVAKRSITLF